MQTINQAMEKVLQSHPSSTQKYEKVYNEKMNGLESQQKDLATIEFILEVLKQVDNISKPINPIRAASLAKELNSMQMTKQEIIDGCKRYATSLSSQYREIQLSDFTNLSFTSERDLKQAIKDFEDTVKQHEARVKAFEDEVNRRVEQRLKEIAINLQRMCKDFPSEEVIASNALYRARIILEERKRREIEALIPKMVEELNRVYDEMRKHFNQPKQEQP